MQVQNHVSPLLFTASFVCKVKALQFLMYMATNLALLADTLHGAACSCTANCKYSAEHLLCTPCTLLHSYSQAHFVHHAEEFRGKFVLAAEAHER